MGFEACWLRARRLRVWAWVCDGRASQTAPRHLDGLALSAALQMQATAWQPTSYFDINPWKIRQLGSTIDPRVTMGVSFDPIQHR
jgi:hypothetical protein